MIGLTLFSLLKKVLIKIVFDVFRFTKVAHLDRWKHIGKHNPKHYSTQDRCTFSTLTLSVEFI